MRPFLKWPGGKFKLLEPLLTILPSGTRFIEPFAGSGAVFLNTAYPVCRIADSNPDVVCLFQSLAAGGSAFVRRCRTLFTPDANTKDIYYQRREQFNALRPGPARAPLFLYLNRHSYNGLIRYNSSGKYNVPFGKYVNPYFPEKEMLSAAERIAGADVRFNLADFRETMAEAGNGDIVYCDPPYIPLSATANFTAYAGSVFKPVDQEDLVRRTEQAAARGATVVISNHDSPEARALYKNAGAIHTVAVRRSISCQGGKREMVGELFAVYGR